MNKWIIALLITLVIGIAQQTAVHAQTPVTFTVEPATGEERHFTFQQRGGEIANGTVIIKNRSDEPLEVLLYPALAQTANQGGVSYGDAGSAGSETAVWLTLAQDRLTLPPNGYEQVAFTVNVPRDVVAGEYVAGIIAEKVDGETIQSGGFGVNFIPRAAVAVVVEVPGDWQTGLAVQSITASAENNLQTITAQLQNTGDTGLKPTGNLTIADLTGQELVNQPVQIGYFIRQDSMNYIYNLREQLPDGEYDVTLSLTYDDQTITEKTRLRLEKPNKVQVVSFEPTTEPDPTLVPAIIGVVTPEPPEPPVIVENQIPTWLYALIGGLSFIIVLMAGFMVWQQKQKAS